MPPLNFHPAISIRAKSDWEIGPPYALYHCKNNWSHVGQFYARISQSRFFAELSNPNLRRAESINNHPPLPLERPILASLDKPHLGLRRSISQSQIRSRSGHSVAITIMQRAIIDFSQRIFETDTSHNFFSTRPDLEVPPKLFGPKSYGISLQTFGSCAGAGQIHFTKADLRTCKTDILLIQSDLGCGFMVFNHTISERWSSDTLGVASLVSRH